MIKIKEYESILNSVYSQGVLGRAVDIFGEALHSSAPTNEYIKDFCQMGLHPSVMSDYNTLGLSILMPVVDSKRKLDINDVPEEYINYTGLLAHEFVMGFDTTKGMHTSIFTANKSLLERLFKAGAFENVDKYNKGMKQLFGDGSKPFGNKMVASFEKNSLAMARLDIESVVGDEVSLELIIPNQFRSDYGTTFKLYPYTVFPHLSESLMKFVNDMKVSTFQDMGRKIVDIKGLKIMQAEVDGGAKTRKVAFMGDEVVKSYRRGTYIDVDQQEEAQIQLKNQIKKTKCGWDCLKRYMKGFNLEASLYGVPYTTIRFERLINIAPCSLKEIDTRMFMVDFDALRRLFRARVNSWRLDDFKEFNKIVNTDNCSNIPDRKQIIDSWANNMDDSDLFIVMHRLPHLFEVETNGKKKSIRDGLNDMYKQKPRAAKSLELVDLEPNFTDRKKQVQDLLRRGVCRIESSSSRTGAPRRYLATNNQDVLTASYGPTRLIAFESTKKTVENLIAMIEKGKVSSYTAFVTKLHQGGIDGIVNYGHLDDNSTSSDWINVLEITLSELNAKSFSKGGSSAPNPYLVNFRRINADNANEFYGAVDVRNIESIEFGEQKSK